jgi:hypothetical protein
VGCRSYKKLAVVQREKFQFDQSAANSGSMAGTVNLAGAETGHRLLLVAFSQLANPGYIEPTFVRYGNTNMTQLTEGVYNNIYSALYVLTECALVAEGTGKKVSVQVPPGGGYGGVMVDTVLLQNVEQTLSAVTAFTTGSANAASLTNVAIPVDGWFYGLATSQVDWAAAPTSPAGQPQTSVTGSGNNVHKGIATLWGPLPAATYTYTWPTSSSSNYSVMAAVGMRLVPATTPAVTCP